MTDRELLRRHIEAVWEGLTLPPLDASAQDFVVAQVQPPWALYLGEVAQEQVAVWRADVPLEQRPALRARAQRAGTAWEPALAMQREVVFSAPTLSAEQLAQAQRLARVLTDEDTDRINAFEAGSAPIFLKPRNAPCVGVVVDGRVLSIAHSSRHTAVARELGVDTLPEARQRGYAQAATTLWTALVQQQGLTPIYSAFAWNAASLRLAQVVGYTPRIQGVYGPAPEHDE